MLCSGYEIGEKILTGKRLIAQPLLGGPVRDAYAAMMSARPSDRNGRMSWDQTAVLVAVRGPERYFSVERGTVRMDGEGRDTWRKDPEGPHARLLPKLSVGEVTRVIEDLMMAVPGKKIR